MPTYLLPDHDIVFPHPLLVDHADGLLAIGGPLTIDRILLAYHFGIFPWFNPGEPVQWFFPDPRSVIFPGEIKVSKSMRRYFNQSIYSWTLNRNFDAVIHQCQTAGERQMTGSWIGDEILKSFKALHKLGYAHSIEVWEQDTLVGGLYGIWIGKVFFGESMFSIKKNASKFGFISFVKKFHNAGKLNLVDCQIENAHLVSLGARNISKTHFLNLIKSYGWKTPHDK